MSSSGKCYDETVGKRWLQSVSGVVNKIRWVEDLSEEVIFVQKCE